MTLHLLTFFEDHVDSTSMVLDTQFKVFSLDDVCHRRRRSRHADLGFIGRNGNITAIKHSAYGVFRQIKCGDETNKPSRV